MLIKNDLRAHQPAKFRIVQPFKFRRELHKCPQKIIPEFENFLDFYVCD